MDIYTLDSNFQDMPGVTAVFLVIGPEGPIFIETGPASTIPTITAALADHGYAPADIRHILLTHIHLDHAGAAGWWAQQGAQIYVHPVGAPHLIDPTKLIASATRIYGDRMEQLWGQILPAPVDKVKVIHNGETVHVSGLSFTAIDTPGHAFHHYVYRLGDIGFTGDAAGVYLPRTGVISLPAPPPEFQLELWQATVKKIEAEGFTTIYPTHFGQLEHVTSHLQAFHALLAESVEFIAKLYQAGVGRDAIIVAYIAWNQERMRLHGAADQELGREELANPMQMSVDGILRYLRKKAEQ